MPADALTLLTFKNAAAFEAWLAQQPSDAAGAWLKFAKLGAPEPTVSKSDAIDCALAHGWIDGQLGAVDEAYFKTRFTPRKSKSLWSQVNRERIAALTDAGRMTPRGQEQVDRAKADGRWEAAYASQSKPEVPADLAEVLDAEPRARALFDALDGANRYAVLHRVHQAKAGAARAAKIEAMVAALARGDTIYPRKAKRG